MTHCSYYCIIHVTYFYVSEHIIWSLSFCMSEKGTTMLTSKSVYDYKSDASQKFAQ